MRLSGPQLETSPSLTDHFARQRELEISVLQSVMDLAQQPTDRSVHGQRLPDIQALHRALRISSCTTVIEPPVFCRGDRCFRGTSRLVVRLVIASRLHRSTSPRRPSQLRGRKCARAFTWSARQTHCAKASLRSGSHLKVGEPGTGRTETGREPVNLNKIENSEPMEPMRTGSRNRSLGNRCRNR